MCPWQPPGRSVGPGPGARMYESRRLVKGGKALRQRSTLLTPAGRSPSGRSIAARQEDADRRSLLDHGVDLDHGIEQIAEALDDRQAQALALPLVDRPLVRVTGSSDLAVGRFVE